MPTEDEQATVKSTAPTSETPQVPEVLTTYEAALAENIAVIHELRPELLRPSRGRWVGPKQHPTVPAPCWASSGGMFVIASIHDAPDDTLWLHVSFSRAARMPDYADMAEIRDRFFRPEDCVVPLPKTSHTFQILNYFINSPFCSRRAAGNTYMTFPP